jgi:hypothetical protein
MAKVELESLSRHSNRVSNRQPATVVAIAGGVVRTTSKISQRGISRGYWGFNENAEQVAKEANEPCFKQFLRIRSQLWKSILKTVANTS